MAKQVIIPAAIVLTVSDDGPGTVSDKTTVISKPASRKYAEGWEALFGATQDGQDEAALSRRALN